MNYAFKASHLKGIMHTMFPDLENDRDDRCSFEHPMTAVGIVLLSAALLGTTDGKQLTAFTGYSLQFVSAIASNMLNNRLWTKEGYDHSAWLLKDGTIEAERLWEHIDVACGMMWMPNAATEFSADPCGVYWGERGGLVY